MKKKIIFAVVILVVVILAIILLLSSCLPKEYRVGVKLDRDYPEDELPIYDDAIVYECDDDKDEITVNYGTDDDIDDVIDFYMDFFEDEEDFIYVNEEDDKDSYEAEGSNNNFEFEIEVEEPKYTPEKRAFNTIVEVTIIFIEDQTGNVQSEQTDSVTDGTDNTDEIQGIVETDGTDQTDYTEQLSDIDIVDINGFDWSTMDWDSLDIETSRMTDEYLRENIVGTWEIVERSYVIEDLSEYSIVDTYNEDGSFKKEATYKYEDDTLIVYKHTGTWKVENQLITVEHYYEWEQTGPDGTYTDSDSSTFCSFIMIHDNPSYLYLVSSTGYYSIYAPYGP